MKFQVGDKVKYGSGDWWFYGTVTAIMENSIIPGYRLSVDRMVKKNCRFSITQFEFELDADKADVRGKDGNKWENLENEFLKKYFEVPKEGISEGIQPETAFSELTPEEEREPVETPQTPKEDTPRLKRSDAWERNFESYKKGDRSKRIHTWISLNRKQYKADELPTEKREKLMEIQFPFEARAKLGPKGSWSRNLELWKKGERKSLQEWRQKSVKLYVDGKLGNDKIESLKELGILK